MGEVGERTRACPFIDIFTYGRSASSDRLADVPGRSSPPERVHGENIHIPAGAESTEMQRFSLITDTLSGLCLFRTCTSVEPQPNRGLERPRWTWTLEAAPFLSHLRSESVKYVCWDCKTNHSATAVANGAELLYI